MRGWKNWVNLWLTGDNEVPLSVYGDTYKQMISAAKEVAKAVGIPVYSVNAYGSAPDLADVYGDFLTAMRYGGLFTLELHDAEALSRFAKTQLLPQASVRSAPVVSGTLDAHELFRCLVGFPYQPLEEARFYFEHSIGCEAAPASRIQAA